MISPPAAPLLEKATVYTYLEDNSLKGTADVRCPHSARSRFGVYILNPSPPGRRTLNQAPLLPQGVRGWGMRARNLEQLSDLCIHSSLEKERRGEVFSSKHPSRPVSDNRINGLISTLSDRLEDLFGGG